MTADKADIWTNKATLKIVAKSGDTKELEAILKYMKLFNGENEIKASQEKNVFIWTGLGAKTKYEVIAKCNEIDTAIAKCELTTESELQLPNNTFDDWETEDYDGKEINKGGEWKKKKNIIGLIPKNEIHQEDTTLSVKRPASWVTVNAKTMPNNASNKNTWYVVASTNQGKAITEGNSVLLRNVGWDNNGGAIPAYGDKLDKFPGNKYLNSPTNELAHYSAGRLFLGEYSYDHSTNTDTYTEGYEFASRPKQLTFKHKYISKVDKTSDKAYVRVRLEHRGDNGTEIIIENTVELGHTETATGGRVPLTYKAGSLNATHICVMFCSSIKGKEMKQSYEESISHPDRSADECKVQVCVSGSEFYIDDLNFEY